MFLFEIQFSELNVETICQNIHNFSNRDQSLDTCLSSIYIYMFFSVDKL